ncbi:MAG TPA: tripartite tricarboxylate transporter TctB family protein [Vineibacter sp.]|nr:tripartite tricarboxylate transporter TctB family protein [Vineibacter sp.]
MKSAVAVGAGWSALGLYIAIAAYDLGIGNAGEPGPGLLAFLLGLVMVVLGGAGAARGVVALVGARGGDAAPARWPWRMAALAVALVVYIAALQPIGYPLATAAFLAALFLGFAQLAWPKAIVLSIALAGVSYALFKLALGVQLPAGVLG